MRNRLGYESLVYMHATVPSVTADILYQQTTTKLKHLAYAACGKVYTGGINIWTSEMNTPLATYTFEGDFARQRPSECWRKG